ncbi:MAG: recombinase family protein [Ruthenibacterium lactatiformans]
MLKNETYIGNMVQGRMVKISYKSKKCLRQAPEDWVVVKGTHEPLVDQETFRKVQMLVNSRKHTRSRTYDFLLKGLLFCHECGYPMSVINRKNAAGEDRLFFVCRTYQRFTKAGVCTCHSIKEETVNEAVLSKIRDVCHAYLNPELLQPIAEKVLENNRKEGQCEAEIQLLQSKISNLTANLDRMYMDRINGLLSESDFQRVYNKTKMERNALEHRLEGLRVQKEQPANTTDKARALVQRFMNSAFTSREVLVSLVERIELTENKEIIIKFRFHELEAIS